MATEAYEVVGALREMLQSQERRESSRVQTALAGMQFAQQKKMQDIQLAGQQLQFLQTVNTQMMTSESTKFLTSTGFGALYSEEEDGVTDAIEQLTDKPKIKDGQNVGGYGFSEHDANRIATAVWMAYKGSPSAILSIADELNTAYRADAKSLSAGQTQLLTGFVNSGYISKEQYESGEINPELESISKVVTNTRDIAAEMYEYGRGDYEIQRDIGIFEPTEEIAGAEVDYRKAADAFAAQQEEPDVSTAAGKYPMVEEGATTEDITSGYGLLPPVAAAAARQKLASLDAVLGELQSEYDALSTERTSIIGSYDENFSDYKQAVKAYDISVNAGLDRADLDHLAADAREYRSAAMAARREQEAINQYNRNPRRVMELSRQGKDWRHSVSRTYIEPEDQDMKFVGGVPYEPGTINLTNTTTYKMTELASKIFSVQQQRERLSLQ